MNLTTAQRDSLTELVNIAYGRAAAALSQMTSDRVLLEVPRLSLIGPAEIEAAIGSHFTSQVTCVNQVFTGPIAGRATLLLDSHAARILAELVSDSAQPPTPVEIEETANEVGNVLINACLGVFGNLLRVQVGFTVPNVQVKSAAQMVQSFKVESETLDHTLLVHTRFRLKQSNVVGYLALMLGVASYDRLIEEVDDWSGM